MKELHHRGATATERIARWTMSRVHLQAGQFKNSIYFKTDDRETMQQFLPLSYKNWPAPASFSFIFGLFEQTIQFYSKYLWKNVHPVYGAGIQSHDLWKVSLFPYPLDKGSRPFQPPFLSAHFQFHLSPIRTLSLVHACNSSPQNSQKCDFYLCRNKGLPTTTDVYC